MIRLTVAALLLASPASAQEEGCGTRASAVAILEKYGETLQMQAVNTEGMLIEMFGNPEEETWTLLASDTTGNTCVLDLGTGWGVARQGKPT